MNASRRSGALAAAAILLALALIPTSGVEGATVTRGPYLQMGTPDRIVVRWRTDVATDSRVSYGLCYGEPHCLTWETVDAILTTEHVVALEGLAPNTRYYYAIGSTEELHAGNDSGHYFLTGAPLGISKRTRIWVLGDSGTGNDAARQVRDVYYAHAGSEHTDLWLMLGDNAYNRGTDGEYQTAVFNTYADMLRKSVLWPSFGNHDGASASASTETGPYFDIFSLPRNAEAGGVPSGTEAYYSFDHANIHFVVLDSFGSDRSPDGPMLTWLRADLQATRQDWTIAYWHHPPYSKGSHNSNTETPLKQMREYALPILEDYGVDLVLAGHSHSYERSHLLDGHYGTSSTLVSSMILDASGGRPDGNGAYVKPSRGSDPHKGTVYAVAGSSGKISTDGAMNHPAMFVSLEILGSLALTVEGNRLDATFLESTGAVRDSFTILKGSPSNLEIVPSLHAFGSVPLGTEASQTFTIRNRGTVDLQVTPGLFGDAANEFVIVQGDAPFTLASGAIQTLDIRFAPTSEGPKSTLLRLITNEPDQDPVDTTLSGIGTVEPDIDVALTALDYGEVLVGTTSTQPFTILNLGTGDLVISATSLVDADADEFAISGGTVPVTIAPATTHNIDVQFAPTTGGSKTTTLRLTSDDPDENPLDVILSGTATTAPEIDVPLTVHDYGVVWVGREGHQTFGIQNTGSADLQLVGADLIGGDSAEFAVAQGPAPFTLPPGVTHNLVVRFAPVSTGQKVTTLRLVSDDQDEHIVDLTLRGSALMPPDVDTVTSWSYGSVVMGTEAADRIIISNLGGANLRVSGASLIEGQAEDFTVTQGGAPFAIGPGEAHILEIRFAPTSRGPRGTTLRLTSDDPDEGVVDIGIWGIGLLPPDIDLASTTRDYGQAVVGTTAFWDLVIGNLGDVDLHVTAPSFVGTDSTQFTLTDPGAFAVAPGTVHTLNVRFVPTSGGPKAATLRLASDDPDEGTIDVSVSGIALMPPDIEVGATLHDYGEVLVGTSAAQTFVISNLGDVDLQVTATSLVGNQAGEFAITQGGGRFTVRPGATHALEVNFTPTSGGQKAATLRLISDDGDEGAVDVALTGNAMTAPEIDAVLTPLHYGDTLVGAISSRTFAIQNTGSADLHATASLIGGQATEFAVTPATPITVSPGAMLTIEIAFVPASGGPKATTLRLTSDDTDEATVEVGLSGVGMMPADIDLAPSTHDYGHVLLGTTASQMFRIRNLGDVNLQVTAVGLVDGDRDEFAIAQGNTPFTVAPGASHDLEVRFIPLSAGPKSTRLRLVSDDQDETLIDVNLTGTATTAPEIDVMSATQNFGVVWLGADSSRTFIVRNVGSANLEVTDTSLNGSDAGQFAITQGGAPFTLAPGGTHNLDVRFTPASAGVRSAIVRLTSNDQDEATIDLAVGGTGIMPPDIEVIPTEHNFGEVVVGLSRSRTFAITNSGGADLQVTAASFVGFDASEFAVGQGAAPFTVASGATHNLEIRLAPTSEGLKTTTLRLTTDDPDEGAVDVHLNGTATSLVPDIAVQPDSHDYGSLAVGTAVGHAFVVNNIGTKDLVVSALTLSGPDAEAFTVVNGLAGFTVTPGASHLIEVRFSPATAGPKNAVLTVRSDDPDESDLLIPLEGTTPPTFVEAAEGGSSSANTVTTGTSLTGVPGNLYLAAVSTKPYRQVSTFEGLGLTWRRVATQCAGRSQTGIEVWWAQGSASTDQVRATLVDAPSNAVIGVARYAGVAPANPVVPVVAGNTNGVNGGCDSATDTATYAFNVTTTQPNSLVFGAVALRNNTHTSTAGYTTRVEVSNGTAGNVAGMVLVDRTAPEATLLPLNGSLNSPVDWALIGIELRSEP